jgi:hypothetical protein
MIFLPEKMKARRAMDVKDSDEESENEYLDMGTGEDLGGGELPSCQRTAEEASSMLAAPAKGRSKKRKSDTMKTVSEESAFQCTQDAALSKRHRRSAPAEATAASEKMTSRDRTLRRQSTMTQLADGRRPLLEVDEPDFRPVKRSPRLSWSGKNKNKSADKQQRTLTQMVPRMRPYGVMSDEDIEEDMSGTETHEKGSEAYDNAITQRLAEQGVYRAAGRSDEQETVEYQETGTTDPLGKEIDHSEDGLPLHTQTIPGVVVQSVEDIFDGDDEETYQPTQYIDAPVTRTMRVRRRNMSFRGNSIQPGDLDSISSKKLAKSRFSLLSTPEKRRVREIPSSQSPADSPLSTQASPQGTQRWPLHDRSANTAKPAESPSRRKRVAFKEPVSPLPPPKLRKFESTIQDSEDENDEIMEEERPATSHFETECMKDLAYGSTNLYHGRAIGADTQAALEQIDRACANANEGITSHRDSSADLEDLTTFRAHQELSPELGEQQDLLREPQQEACLKGYSNLSTHDDIKPISSQDHVEGKENTPLVGPDPLCSVPIEQNEAMSTQADLPIVEEQLRSSPPLDEAYVQDTCPSTPMVIQDDSSDEGETSEPAPARKGKHTLLQPVSLTAQPSADLDGKPVQVPRSPSMHAETQQSHSSKAEQQLQNEWLSYSQYVDGRPPGSSSMNVAHDAFSYNATPRPPRNTVAQPCGRFVSQATTVDEVTQRTPQKSRTQLLTSANTTPHRIASSQPIISPNKPPPLFIPSSFPSPAKAAMEGWSSPALGRTQDVFRSSQFGTSLEDFSIPLPPPIEDD